MFLKIPFRLCKTSKSPTNISRTSCPNNTPCNLSNLLSLFLLFSSSSSYFFWGSMSPFPSPRGGSPSLMSSMKIFLKKATSLVISCNLFSAFCMSIILVRTLLASIIILVLSLTLRSLSCSFVLLFKNFMMSLAKSSLFSSSLVLLVMSFLADVTSSS